MKKLFLFSTLILWVNSVSSHHVAGAYITYQYTGNPNQFEIKLTKYRDCFGLAFPAVDTVCISSASFGNTFYVVLTLNGPAYQINQCCIIPGPTTCQGGSSFGIEKYEYTGIVTLPFACNDWRIDYPFELIEKMGIGGPPPVYGDVHSMINNYNFPQNSSPSIHNDPCFMGSVTATNCFSYNVTDTNNNSFYFNKELTDTASAVSCPANITGQTFGDFTSIFYDSLHIDSASGMFCVNLPMFSWEFYSMRITENLGGSSLPYIKGFFTYLISSGLPCTSAINEIPENNFRVFPNPGLDFISIESLAGDEKNLSVKIFNIYGQQLENVNPVITGVEGTKINVSIFPSGAYILELKSEEKIWRLKFLKN